MCIVPVIYARVDLMHNDYTVSDAIRARNFGKVVTFKTKTPCAYSVLALKASLCITSIRFLFFSIYLA